MGACPTGANHVPGQWCPRRGCMLAIDHPADVDVVLSRERDRERRTVEALVLDPRRHDPIMFVLAWTRERPPGGSTRRIRAVGLDDGARRIPRCRRRGGPRG